MNYREFLSLTDEEIEFIVRDIFDTVNIENIERDPIDNTITCDITTDGWSVGENEDFVITDTLTLSEPTPLDPGIDVDFSLDQNHIKKWRQFCIAKGCNPYLKDNSYLNN